MTRAGIAIVVLVTAVAGVAAGYLLAPGRSVLVAGTPPAAPEKAERPILYYRNPMGLPDTSPAPKKDPMGMDYIPVYEGEALQAEGGTIAMSTERVQKLGVRTEPAGRRDLARSVRAVGTLQVDERRQHTVAPKFEGWIEVLRVNSTGQAVAKGQPLMEVYSPELLSATQEYAIARRGLAETPPGDPEARLGLERLAESALARLRNWDISDEQLESLQQSPGSSKRRLVLSSPAGGTVLEKKAVAGMRFMPGEMLYRIADLSSLWLVVDVFEQDLGLIKVGDPVRVRINAVPDQLIQGKAAFVYPSVNPDTRTAQVRVELPNPQGLLKPAMYANVEFSTGARRQVLAVPDSAVLDSGTRKLVLVERAPGRFEPRQVKTGLRGDQYVEILDGIGEGENVVVAANFLIDAESNLKAALGGFGSADGGGARPPQRHAGRATVNRVDAQAGTVGLTHGPVPTLNWPPMTMDFRVKDPVLLRQLKPGQEVEIEIVQEGPADFVLTAIRPAGAEAKPSTPAAAGHQH
ncbi:MAG TPA: efflux RND transporter periplasmic adaptor subunit [Burkholderiales bacterium]